MVFSIEMTFCVHSSSHGLIFVYIRGPQMDIHCTQEFSGYYVVYKRVQNAFLCDLTLLLLLCSHGFVSFQMRDLDQWCVVNHFSQKNRL